jgi:6,7-dimethyl-8-ribityllumazine synthase
VSKPIGEQSGLKAEPHWRIAVLASRWNEEIISRLLSGCEGRLREMGLGVLGRGKGAEVEGEKRGGFEVFRVPGAYELPLGALWAIKEGFDAAICIGCVIRGETWHFEAVAGECARGVRMVGLRTGKPVIFGVLTVENEEQALARSGGAHGHAGRSAAEAAVEMLHLKGEVRESLRWMREGRDWGGGWMEDAWDGSYGDDDIPF